MRRQQATGSGKREFTQTNLGRGTRIVIPTAIQHIRVWQTEDVAFLMEFIAI